MHRLAAVPGSTSPQEGPVYVEQPGAPVVLLSSAGSDLAGLASLLADQPQLVAGAVRGLNLQALAHPAVIDHYIRTSLAETRLVLVRLLGGRGHWSYGLEQLGAWASRPGRQLLVVAGTEDEAETLAALGTADPQLTLAIGHCLREGGPGNLAMVLGCLDQLLAGQAVEPPRAIPQADPLSLIHI